MQAESLPSSRQDSSSLQIHGRRRLSGVAAVVLCASLSLGGCAGVDGADEAKTTAAPEAARVSPEVFELARKALAENRLKDAEQLSDRILLTNPRSLEARLLRGEVFLAKGKPEQAMAIFSGLQDLPEVRARARQGLGVAMLLTGAPEPAAGHLKAAVEEDPTLWRAWNALGSYYDTQGAWAEAIEAYDLALAEHPNDAMILNNRGFSYFMRGLLDEAIADLERALHLDPELKPAQYNLRLAHAWNGRYVRALAGVTDEELPRVLNNIGYVAMMRGDLKNAEAYLMRAMEVDPAFNETAWQNLARLRHMRELGAEETGSLPTTPRDITAAAPGE
jgi:Tfp pilus assembly protein PilF